MFRTYQTGGFLVAQVLIPAWLIHYYVKYHVMVRAGAGGGPGSRGGAGCDFWGHGAGGGGDPALPAKVCGRGRVRGGLRAPAGSFYQLPVFH